MTKTPKQVPVQEEEETPTPRPLSPWAAELKRLKGAAWNASERWQKLPQPLFWSLFHSAIGDIRKAKSRKRLLENIFDGSEEQDDESSR